MSEERDDFEMGCPNCGSRGAPMCVRAYEKRMCGREHDCPPYGCIPCKNWLYHRALAPPEALR